MEIILALAITAIITGPLALALSSVFRNSRDANERFARSDEAQAIGEAWTRDVQSVAPDGVNEPTNQFCPSIDAGNDTSDELHRVTFNTDQNPESGGSIRRSTWVLKGTGTTADLIRRQCVDGVPVSETVLARDIGKVGVSRSMIVRGPGSDPGDFCPADSSTGVRRSCTIHIEGDFSYELTVTRRVPDLRTSTVVPRVPPPPTVNSHTNRYQYALIYFSPPVLQAGQPAVDQYRVTVRSGSIDGPIAFESDFSPPTGSPSPNGFEYRVEPLTVGVSYWVELKARNSIGWGDVSNAYGPLVPGPSTPDAPTNVVATPQQNGKVRVTWTHAANSGGSPLTYFRIYAYLDGSSGSGADLIGPFEPSPYAEATTFDVSGLNPYSSYRFIVADVNAVGEGFPSAPSTPVLAFATTGTVFVSTGGSDSNSCLTTSSPCSTIARGISVANAQSRSNVIVSAGTFSRFSVTQTPSAGLSVRGGFNSGFTGTSGTTTVTGSDLPPNTYSGLAPAQRSAADVYSPQSNCGAAPPPCGRVALQSLYFNVGDGASGVTVAGLDVYGAAAGVELRSVTVGGGSGVNPTGVRVRSSVVDVISSSVTSPAAGGPNVSTYGMRVLDSSAVRVLSSQVNSTSAGSGSSGSDGVNGTNGSSGGAGGNFSDGSCGGGTGGSATSTSGAGGAGGSGGTGGCGNANGAGGTAGTASGNNNGGGGGGGGSGNIFCSNGGGGQAGGGATAANRNGSVAGSAGIASTPALGSGDAVVVAPVGASGGVGQAGQPGHGGGGGGGGGGHNGGLCNNSDRGGGGGAGGQGGGAASGGNGGGGGAASVAILVNGSTLSVDSASSLSAGNGGAGGRGGAGGTGGNGGRGGNGGSASNNSDGGAGGGGGGGSGGGAGAGGGGGAGGPSVAMYASTNSTVTIAPGAVLARASVSAPGGAAGTAGSPGSGGGGGSKGTGSGGGDGADGQAGGAATGSTASGSPGATGALCRTVVGATCSP